jgi:hypothetical protein
VPSSILVSDAGKVTEVKLVLEKTRAPIFVSDAGKVTEVKPEQLLKASVPILVSDAGKATEVKPGQPAKVPSPILVTPSFITTTLIVPQKASTDVLIDPSGIAPGPSMVRVS